MNKYLKALPIVSAIGVTLLIGFCLGRIQPQNLSAETIEQVSCPTLAQQAKAICNCPEPEIVYNIGCTDEINTEGKVRVKAPIVEKYNELTKEYEDVKTILDYKTLTK